MDPQVNYLTTPAAIVNEALDMLGESGQIIGSLTDGTPVAEAARRYYGQGLRQLLRCAWWGFARKRAELNLLGTTAISPPPLGVSSFVEWPWQFCYEWPSDAIYGRWLPYSPGQNNPASPQSPPPIGTPAGVSYPQIPGRFLITSSDQYPAQVGFTPWNQLPDFQRTVGVGPTNRQVILTNCCNAWFVYTTLVTVIETWPSDFRQGMVLMMAIALAPTAIKDPKLRLAEIARLTPTLRNAVDNARAASANESGFPQTTARDAAWVSARNRGWGIFGESGLGLGGDAGGGDYGCGFGSMSWGGSTF